MTNALDELRNTLINRYQKPQGQPAAPQTGGTAQPEQKPYSMPGAAGLLPSAPMQLLGSNREDVSTKLPQPGVIGGLADAIGGGSAPGTKKPFTGMNPPAWPPTPMPMGPAEIPIGVPNDSAKVPPRWQRFETGQKMQDAIRNDYNPNPMLIRILEGR